MLAGSSRLTTRFARAPRTSTRRATFSAVRCSFRLQFATDSSPGKQCRRSRADYRTGRRRANRQLHRPRVCEGWVNREQARKKYDTLVSRASYAETTRPIIDGRTRGFCKLVIDRRTHQILGCHIVGERAVEVAQMAAIVMTAEMNVDTLARIPLSFPTYANVFGRAALRAIRELGISANIG